MVNGIDIIKYLVYYLSNTLNKERVKYSNTQYVWKRISLLPCYVERLVADYVRIGKYLGENDAKEKIIIEKEENKNEKNFNNTVSCCGTFK